MEGKIKKLIPKGYGFIAVTGGDGKDLFFHAAGLVDGGFNSLKEGDKVTFDGVEETPKGKQAYGIRVVY